MFLPWSGFSSAASHAASGASAGSANGRSVVFGGTSGRLTKRVLDCVAPVMAARSVQAIVRIGVAESQSTHHVVIRLHLAIDEPSDQVLQSTVQLL